MKKIHFALAVLALLSVACEKPLQTSGQEDGQQEEQEEQGDGGGGQDDDDKPVVKVSTATLSFDEFESVDQAKEYVAGYGSERKYTNGSGVWTICAYYYNGGFQINSGKIAYIGTPAFSGNITAMEISVVGSTPDNYYICSESGTTSASGILKTVPVSSSTTCFALDGTCNKLFIRSDGCARISRIVVTYGGVPGGTGEEDDDDGGNTGGGTGGEDDEGGGTGEGNDDDRPAVQSDGAPVWYELPAASVRESGKYLVDANNADYYYAFHKFSYSSGQKARNFSVCYSASNHGPMWVAAPRHAFYHGGSCSGRNYKTDPDIPSSIQIDASGGQTYNKGHMLGRAERDKWSEAHSQVSYLSNIAPQHATTFNTGGGAWNNLEDKIDSYECQDTLYQVVGAHYLTFKDLYGQTNPSGTINWGGMNISYPTMFYYVLLRTKSGRTGKSLKDCRTDELKCVAFVLRHSMNKGHEPCETDMMSVSDLEKITGFTYFPNVPQAPKSSFTASDWGI